MIDNRPVRGFAAFDLDGTLLRGLSVCGLLAAKLGRSARMREIEALSAEEDLEAARREIALWYGSLSREELTHTVLSSAVLAPGVREGLRILREARIVVGIASITWGFAVEAFAKRLGIEHFIGTALHSDGSIVHCRARHKADFVRRMQAELGLDRAGIAGVGDSQNDVEMLNFVGLPIFVGVTLPDGLRAEHMPGAGIDEVARRIVDAWAADAP